MGKEQLDKDVGKEEKFEYDESVLVEQISRDFDFLEKKFEKFEQFEQEQIVVYWDDIYVKIFEEVKVEDLLE